jgi:hypothetical protein
MKRLLFILSIFFMGCTCIAQIPPQYVYVGEDCTATLPDYLNQVTVRDNCQLDTIFQTPGVGYILDAVNQNVQVTITARDAFGNETNMSFEVTAIDTIPPIIEPDTTLLTAFSRYQDVMFKVSHNLLLKELERGDKLFPDSIEIAQDVWLTKEDVLQGDSTFSQSWYENNFIAVFPAGGKGEYLGNYYTPGKSICECDSISMEGQRIIIHL